MEEITSGLVLLKPCKKYKQEVQAVASIARDDLSTLPGDDPFPHAHIHSQCIRVHAISLDRNLKPKLATMHQYTSITQTDRQTDTGIIA